MSIRTKQKLLGVINARPGQSLKGRIDAQAKLTGKVNVGNGIVDDTRTYILVDEAGNEIPAVLVDEPVELTATANDIRIGTIAVTGDGVIEGKKEIPAYHTREGMKVIAAGKPFELTNFPRYDYTKLQAIMCTNLVASQMVCINDKVYVVGSTSVISEVTLDPDRKAIVFGITNEGISPCVIRYFTYKEES